MITLMLTAEQQQIVDSVEEVLRARSVDRLRDQALAPGAAELADWGLFAELGWFAIGLPEEAGGIGYTVLEEMLIARELGRHVISPTVLASTLGAHLAWQSGNAELARAIAAGSEKIALGLPAGQPGSHSVSQEAIRGELYVVDRMDAKWAMVSARGGVALVALDGAALARVDAIDTTLTLERMGANVAPDAFAADETSELRNRITLLLTASLVGMAEASRDLAVEYAKVREQFGKPIGSFQAVAHHCANMAVRAEAAWVQTKFAALALSPQRDDATFQVSAAYLLAAEAASINSAMAIRVHGAMGFTAECSVHHYVKRSVLLKSAAGSIHVHGELLLQQAAAA